MMAAGSNFVFKLCSQTTADGHGY